VGLVIVEKYFYIRYKWWKNVDINKIIVEIQNKFEVESINLPHDDREIVFYPFEREVLKVKADSLIARLAPMRAVLYQTNVVPFTKKDLELRGYVIEMYPYDRMSFLPMFFQEEPKFETINTHNNN
jgi:hypothetical protein